MAPYYVHAKCKTQMRCKKNEVYVIEVATFGPAAIWSADLWACPVCGEEMIAGFGLKPIIEHYQDGFDEALEKAKASDYVDYC